MSRSFVQFYEDDAGEWRWRLFGGNGEIVAHGEGHVSERDARRAFFRVAEIATEATAAMFAGAELEDVDQIQAWKDQRIGGEPPDQPGSDPDSPPPAAA